MYHDDKKACQYLPEIDSFTTMADETNTLLLIIIAILLPPLAVYLLRKSFDAQLVINIILTIIGFWILGILHAVYLIVSGGGSKAA